MKLEDVIKEKRGFDFSGAVTESVINEVEKDMQLVFSKEYHDYLLDYGAVSFYGHEWTGLNCPDRLNVALVTKEEKNHNDSIPADWYVIEQTHIDDIVIWQNGAGEVFTSDFYGRTKKICNSLVEYIS